MDNQTVLNILLGLLTAYLAVRNFLSSNKKDVMRESQEMTEIKVQLNQIMAIMHDMQKDIRTSTADFRALSERVVKLETKLEMLSENFELLRKDVSNGKHE